MENWTSVTNEFNPVVINDSKRIIEGVASAPIYDRVNELITADALKRAVPDYMVLPIVTVGHKEFIAGVVKKIWFDDSDRMNIRVQLKQTDDVTPVWNAIKAGYLNAFSIAGTRTSSTCPIGKQSPTDSPCITDGVRLNSITICGSDKCNQEAHFEIAKTLSYIYDNQGLTDMTENEVSPSVETVEPTVEKTVETTVEETQANAGFTIDYQILAKAIVEEQNKLVKECEGKEEEKKEEPKEEADDIKKSLDELKEMFKTQADSISSLSARLEKIESIPMGKTVGFQMVDGKPMIVDLSDMQKAVESNEPAVSDIRLARKSTFRV